MSCKGILSLALGTEELNLSLFEKLVLTAIANLPLLGRGSSYPLLGSLWLFYGENSGEWFSLCRSAAFSGV